MAETALETISRHPIDLLKAYKLRTQHHLSYRQIATQLAQPPASIHRALVDLCSLLDQPERLDTYQDARGALLSAVEERLIGSLVDSEALSKASLNNRAYAFTQIFNARRLETGQSTNNVSILGQLIHAAEAQLGAAKVQPASVQMAQATDKAEPEA